MSVNKASITQRQEEEKWKAARSGAIYPRYLWWMHIMTWVCFYSKNGKRESEK